MTLSHPLIVQFFNRQFVFVKVDVFRDNEVTQKLFPEYDLAKKIDLVNRLRPMQWVDPASEQVLLQAPGKGGPNLLIQRCRKILNQYPQYDQMLAEERNLEQAVRREPASAERWFELGRHLYESLKFEAAHEALGKAVEKMSPGEKTLAARVHYALGLVYGRLARWEDSRTHFAKALEFDPEDALGHAADISIETAYQDLTLRRWGQAREGYESTLDRFPRHLRTPEVVFNLGRAYLELGQKQSAIALYEKLMNSHSPMNDRERESIVWEHWRLTRKGAPLDSWRQGDKTLRRYVDRGFSGPFVAKGPSYPGERWDLPYPDITEVSGADPRAIELQKSYTTPEEDQEKLLREVAEREAAQGDFEKKYRRFFQPPAENRETSSSR